MWQQSGINIGEQQATNYHFTTRRSNTAWDLAHVWMRGWVAERYQEETLGAGARCALSEPGENEPFARFLRSQIDTSTASTIPPQHLFSLFKSSPLSVARLLSVYLLKLVSLRGLKKNKTLRIMWPVTQAGVNNSSSSALMKGGSGRWRAQETTGGLHICCNA